MECNMEDGKTFIANDYVMRRSAGRLQIVTGPNSESVQSVSLIGHS